MGRCRSFENIEYKNKLIEAICDNDALVRLITPESIDVNNNDFDPTETLPYKYIMPYNFIAGTQTEKGRYLSFDIESSYHLHNNVVKNMVISVNIICHKDLIKYKDSIVYEDRKGYYSCWWDLVTCEIDELLCGDNTLDFGIGKFELVSNEPYFVSFAREIPFSGRTLVFKNIDYTDGKKYGK